MKKKSVLIPDCENYQALDVVRSLGCSNEIEVHAVATKSSAVRLSKYCKTFALAEDDDARLERVTAILRHVHIDVIMPVAENGIMFVHKHRNVLGPLATISPLPNPDVFDVARDKWLFYEFARQHDVQTPRSFLISRDVSRDSLIANLTYPVIVKPTIGHGGWGIERFDSENKLLAALAKYEKDSSKARIIQEYREGSDVDISVLCKDGRVLAFTIQHTLVKNSTNVFAYGQIIEFIQNADVLAAATKLLSSLKWTGVAHLDCIWEERDGVSILEINPRFWGTLLGSTAAGVNFPYLAFLVAQGISFPLPEYRTAVFARLSVKEWLSWPLGRRPFPGLAVGNTNLRFVLGDPRPTVGVIFKIE